MITGNRVRPVEVTDVPLSLRAVLSTSNFLSKNVFSKGFRTHQLKKIKGSLFPKD